MLTRVQPRIRIAVSDCRADTTAGGWLVTWLVSNDGASPVALHEAWLPHGRFRGDGRAPLRASVPPGDSAALTLRVRAAEAPHSRVENAFLILRASVGGVAWRIFGRMRIEFSP